MAQDQKQPSNSRRQEIRELADKLQRVKDSSQEVQAVVRLVALLFEERRDDLLRATPETFRPLQGEANALQDLLKNLTTPRPSIPKD